MVRSYTIHRLATRVVGGSNVGHRNQQTLHFWQQHDSPREVKEIQQVVMTKTQTLV